MTTWTGSVMQLVRLDLSSHVLSGDLPLGLRALHLLEARARTKMPRSIG